MSAHSAHYSVLLKERIAKRADWYITKWEVDSVSEETLLDLLLTLKDNNIENIIILDVRNVHYLREYRPDLYDKYALLLK